LHWSVHGNDQQPSARVGKLSQSRPYLRRPSSARRSSSNFSRPSSKSTSPPWSEMRWMTLRRILRECEPGNTAAILPSEDGSGRYCASDGLSSARGCFSFLGGLTQVLSAGQRTQQARRTKIQNKTKNNKCYEMILGQDITRKRPTHRSVVYHAANTHPTYTPCIWHKLNSLTQ
jgi:hypothetical protein